MRRIAATALGLLPFALVGFGSWYVSDSPGVTAIVLGTFIYVDLVRPRRGGES